MQVCCKINLKIRMTIKITDECDECRWYPKISHHMTVYPVDWYIADEDNLETEA